MREKHGVNDPRKPAYVAVTPRYRAKGQGIPHEDVGIESHNILHYSHNVK